MSSLAEFAAVLKRVKANAALCYGVFSGASPRRIALKSSADVREGRAIARAREFFSYPSPGVFFLDYDEGARSFEEVDTILSGAWPDWGRTERLWVPSSGSFIFQKSTGLELAGSGGWHAYMLVDDGSKIPALTTVLHRQLWQNGYGRIVLSAAGSMLERGLIDAGVSQPERLDFAAEPRLCGDLERRAPAPVLLPGAPMASLAALPKVSKRKHTEVVALARLAVKPESERLRRVKIAADVAKGVSLDAAERKWSLAAGGDGTAMPVLTGDFELFLADGRMVTVQQILDDPEEFDELRCADPHDPSYRNDGRIAIIYSLSEIIYSHAHGGLTYLLAIDVVDEDWGDNETL